MKLIVTITFVLFSLFSGTLQPAFAQAGKPKVLLLSSHNTPQFQQTLESVKKYISEKISGAQVDTLNLDGDASKATQALSSAKGHGVDLVITLGSIALDAAVKAGNGLPVVAGLVLSAEEIKSRPNITGVLLDFPPEAHLQWLKRMLPRCGSVGILYNQGRFSGKAESMKQVAAGMGLKLYAQKVEKVSELPAALEDMYKKVDVLLGLPDDVIYNSQTAKHVLLASFQQRIPMVGLSGVWVKAGALYSLDCDFKDLGAQCGEMAAKVLGGKKPESIQPEFARKVNCSANVKTAEQMKINLPDAVLQSCQEVFR